MSVGCDELELLVFGHCIDIVGNLLLVCTVGGACLWIYGVIWYNRRLKQSQINRLAMCTGLPTTDPRLHRALEVFSGFGLETVNSERDLDKLLKEADRRIADRADKRRERGKLFTPTNRRTP